MDVQTDKNLVESCLEGDKEAYGKLVIRHYKNIFLTCLGLLGNIHDAEDVAQDVMIKSYEKLGTLHDSSSFGSWTAKIAKNMCINYQRRQKPYLTVSEDLTTEKDSSWETESLMQAMQKLHPEYRLPLVMFYFDGHNVKSVAQKLNVSTSTIYAKLRNAIKQLQCILAEKE